MQGLYFLLDSKKVQWFFFYSFEVRQPLVVMAFLSTIIGQTMELLHTIIKVYKCPKKMYGYCDIRDATCISDAVFHISWRVRHKSLCELGGATYLRRSGRACHCCELLSIISSLLNVLLSSSLIPNKSIPDIIWHIFCKFLLLPHLSWVLTY